MIKTVMFDMGGTLEDIWVDEESSQAAIVQMDRMLRSYGLDPGISLPELRELVDRGWRRYDGFRSKEDVELKPIELYCDYVLEELHFERELLAPHTEEIAHMWETTHYHRVLRPGVREMLDRLSTAGVRLGIISNTAALYQVFDSLEEYGIRDCFADVTLSSVCGLRKPRTEIFTVAMRQLRAAPEESAYVGDTVSRDIIGAKRAGLAIAIQIGSKLTREKDSGVRNGISPDYFIEDIGEVAPIILEHNRREAEA